VDTVEEAIDLAIQLAEGEAMILVAGSLFVAAAARQIWFQRNHEAVRE
jgi:folylpolyglutamate synthase/dihydropteroate synthase